jgi:transcription elongation factor Elf1
LLIPQGSVSNTYSDLLAEFNPLEIAFKKCSEPVFPRKVFPMSIRKVSMMVCAVLAVGFMAFAAEEKAKSFKATCPVSGKPALEDKTVDYKGAKVYFCCGNCPGAFTKDTAKYSAKANEQLFATGQATQVKCPLTGAKLNPDATVEIAGSKVAFCCEKCQAKANEAKGDAQVDLAFSDAAFAKGFEIKKK